jgi:hypothetical protein
MFTSDAMCLQRQIELKHHLLRLVKKSLKSSVHFTSINHKEALRECVWVDGVWLRSMLACPLDICGDLLNPKNHICAHGKGIDPKTASSGKIIPRKFFDELMATMRYIHHIQEDDVCVSKNHCLLLSEINCQLCSDEYVSALRAKISYIQRLQTMFQCLDTRNDVSTHEGCSQYVYAVSKTFISTFRKCIGKLLKAVEKIDPMARGLHSLPDVSLASLQITEVDNTVNSSILCKFFNHVHKVYQ